MSTKKGITKVCNFCGSSESDVQMMIQGRDAQICDNCIQQAYDIISQELDLDTVNSKKNKKAGILPKFDKTPVQIKHHLDNYVIGQDDAKKILAVAVYNHYKRLQLHGKKDEVEIEKSNIVLVGRTGTGKTLLARTIARLLNVPFAIVDATVFTEAGYVGEDLESMLTRLLQVCEYDVEQAERGIVYIDEIDKIARKQDNPSITRDVSGEGVQQGLLKMLEGAEVLVPPQGGRKHPDQKMVKINTQNILFICGGAFDGIEKLIARRLNTQVIGFNADLKEKVDRDNLLSYIIPQDLRSFGLIPELVGRMPVLTYLEPLDLEALVNILTKPKNAILKQYQKLFEMEGVKLTFSDEAVQFIAGMALEYNLGARGLRAICEAIMTDLMFEMPSQKNVSSFELTLDYAERHVKKSMFKKLKVA